MRSKKIKATGMCTIEGIQNNQFNDGYTKWVFNRELLSPIYQPSEWRHAVGFVDGLFYHLDNEVMSLFQNPISRLVGKQEQLNYFIRLERVFILRPKHQDKRRQIKRHCRQLMLDIGYFCIGKENARY